MRYVADPLSEDPGLAVSSPAREGNFVVSTSTEQKADSELKSTETLLAGVKAVSEEEEEEEGRPSILRTLRECIGQNNNDNSNKGRAVVTKGGRGGGGGSGGGKPKDENVNVAVWDGVAGDDHVPGGCSLFKRALERCLARLFSPCASC